MNQVVAIRARRIRVGVIWLIVLIVAWGTYEAGSYLIRAYWRISYPLEYQSEIFKFSRLNGLDPYLVAAVIRTESRFSPVAVSPKGAVGLMQIMPETGKWVANQLGISRFEPDMLYDPEMNIMIGTWYLKDLYTEFDGNTILALAAYNSGRNRVREWIRVTVLDGQEINVEIIPYPETRRFVEKVMSDYRRYKIIYGPLESSAEDNIKTGKEH